ncbi:hypothetical protein BGZ50_007553 [Haplosporangium sp. Z 11]|nr:hypothetical protein BGZ50_007553 [Haplosporangium sp. Z 11]
MTQELPATNNTPLVIIAGAGLGGLMMGLLLEKINIPYQIFERTSKVKPLGAAMALGPNVMPVFEQLGLLEELKKISLPCPSLNLFQPDMRAIGSIAMKGQKQATGYDNIVFTRPRLYNLLLKQVPAHKISYGKRILKTEEKDNKIWIHCSDGSVYEGDILIGADGAYSGVRLNLYKQLNEKGILPKVDMENLSLGYICMVGIASPENPEKYPQLKDDFVHFDKVLGGDDCAWSAVNVADKQICWALTIQVGLRNDTKALQFRNSEWGPESNEAMIQEFYDCPCPFGGKMGDLIDATPKDLISKVFLEEKLFKTWHHGRTVLIGDACHKMLPSAGQGAVNAMQDAVVLANCLYDLEDTSFKSISAALQDYYDQRFHHAKTQFEFSQKIATVMAGQTLMERVIRHAILEYIPHWVQQRTFEKTFAYRPQVAWLPEAENRGTGDVIPQKKSKRYVREQQEKQGHATATVV